MSTDRTLIRDPMIGASIGRHRVLRRIGEGGMGAVYEAVDPVIGQKVAIKILRSDVVQASGSKGLLAEARSASLIRHRGIIQILDFGELPPFGQYLVMELLEGRSLSEVLELRRQLPAQELVPLLDEILEALEAAHQQGVIHRDLKPSNIFLVAESTGGTYVKLLDFGLAKMGVAPGQAAAQTRQSMIIGTPEYMAPEQVSSKPIGPRTDLYALGCLAFEALTGHRPFQSDSPIETLLKQLSEVPPRVSTRVAVPAELDELVWQLMAKDPAARPPSAAEARARLAGIDLRLALRRPASGPMAIPPAQLEALAGAVAPTRISQPLAPVTGARPWRRPAALFAAALVSAGAVGAFVWTARSEPEPAPAPALTAAPPPPPAEPAPSTPPPRPPPTTSPSLARTEPAPVLEQAPDPVPTKPRPRRRRADASATKPPPTDAPAAAPTASAPEPPAAARSALAVSPTTIQVGGVGRVSVSLESGWAEVWVNGVKRGRTPLTLELSAGEHELKLLNPYLAPYQRTIRLERGQRLVHHARLEPL